jgi:hypothetical protein
MWLKGERLIVFFIIYLGNHIEKLVPFFTLHDDSEKGS